MNTFRAYHADILDPAQQSRVLALLGEHGLVTFTGITDRITLADVARRLMSTSSMTNAPSPASTQ